MNARRLLMCVMLVSSCALARCAKPPTKDIELAKANFEKAIAVSADSFASGPMSEARQAQAALDAELKRQASKWFKSYDEADDLAIAVQAAAEEAAANAPGGRARTLAAAKALPDDQLGPNLFENGSFTDGAKPWSLHPQSDSTVTIEPFGPRERSWHVNYRKGNWSVIYQEHPLKPDAVYVYEAWVKTTAPIVSLYWQSETGRFYDFERTYPAWTHLRYVFVTPHWNGQPYTTGFNPILMKAPGEAWLRDLRLSQVVTPPRAP